MSCCTCTSTSANEQGERKRSIASPRAGLNSPGTRRARTPGCEGRYGPGHDALNPPPHWVPAHQRHCAEGGRWQRPCASTPRYVARSQRGSVRPKKLSLVCAIQGGGSATTPRSGMCVCAVPPSLPSSIYHQGKTLWQWPQLHIIVLIIVVRLAVLSSRAPTAALLWDRSIPLILHDAPAYF